MSMKQIRLRIINLLDQHGDTFGKCKGCPICTEIIHLRKKLDRDSTVRFQHILDKGPDMTKSDIAFLLENDVQMNQIKKVVGLPQIDFYEMMFNYGFSKRQPNRGKGKQGRKKEMAKITLEEYQDLKTQGKTDREIAHLKNMHPTYLPPLKKEWGISKNQVVTAKKKPPEIKTLISDERTDTTAEMETLSEIRTSENEGITAQIKAPESKTIQEAIKNAFAEQTAEYERLIAALRNDLTEINIQLDEKDELIRNLQATLDKYEHVNAACEDIENELAILQDDNNCLLHALSKIQDENTNLELENNALKQLVKLWI